jgi:hypothetical protein
MFATVFPNFLFCIVSTLSFHRYEGAAKSSHKIFIPTIIKIHKKVNKSYPCNRRWRPIGLSDVETPVFSRQSADRWR